MSTVPPVLSGSEIRSKFLDFFAAREHLVLSSASLIPEDPTVLLTIAGMLPFKPIFLGQQAPPAPRATTSQKCIRTNDIENVGRTARHHTFFEMLGNFSFGDYFKEQAIAWAWELSTTIYQLNPKNIVVSVFQDDDEAFAIWRDNIGVNPKRIIRMGEQDNFWKSGPTGPCGPCSELYYDFQPELGDENIDLEDDDRFIEYYNLVFMQYNRDAEGALTPLAKQNIDTGLGLERMAQILQRVPNNYETDLIFPIIETAAKLANIDYHDTDEKTKISLKVIGDHVRSVVQMIADGITASNTDRGYILRRLIRRVVRHGRLIGIDGQFINQVAETAIQMLEAPYPNTRERESIIQQELDREEANFLKTLARGEKLLAEIVAKGGDKISGVDAFTLFDTYGFPLELTQEIAEEQGFTVDVAGYKTEMGKQQERAKAAHKTIDLTAQNTIETLSGDLEPTQFVGYHALQSMTTIEAILVDGTPQAVANVGDQVQLICNQTPFYAESGGQIGDRGYFSGDNLLVRVTDVQKESGLFVHYGKLERGTLKVGDRLQATIDRACRRRAQANHTATHLLQAALKAIVDNDIAQAGSLVDFDRLRFDFNCPRALTQDELTRIEDQVNLWITEAHDSDVSVMPIAEAKAKGAVAMFGEKYGADVRVVDFPGVSMELCGGTHVNNTAEIGLFKIISETGISSGVRRIEAIAGASVLDYLKVRDQVVKTLGDKFKAKPEEITDRVEAIQSELRQTQKDLESAKADLAIAKSEALVSKAETIGEFKVLVENMGDLDPKALQTAAERLQQKLGEAAVVLASTPGEGKVSLVAAFSEGLYKGKQLQAGKFIGAIAKRCGGGGGGRPNLAQAGGRDPDKLPEALTAAKQQLLDALG